MSSSDLQGFTNIQRLAYKAVTEVASLIQEGWTEQQAADLVGQYLRDSGVKAFFHEPYAWFGDRTRFDGIRRKHYGDFNPTYRRLKSDDVVILDVAPILDGYTGDIGYTFSLQKNPELEEAKKFLLKLRKFIPAYFDLVIFPSPLRGEGVRRAGEGDMNSGRDIWRKIEDDIQDAGYDNIHKIYPFHVLGHRLRRVPFSGSALATPLRFSLHSFYSILSHGMFPELLGPDHRGSLKGLWAIEPHIGGKNFGAKFEEILIIDEKGARWLDNEVPHVNESQRSKV